MANNLVNPLFIFTFVCLILSLFVSHSSCLNTNVTGKAHGKDGFLPALGTWYGDPRRPGSGGACGWADDVHYPPFSSMISAGNANIFLHGKGCGDCYQIKCTRRPHCSGYPITVTITDECPGACNNVPYHFDLGRTAFGAMANPGQADDLRKLGQVDIQYRRVKCNYGKTTIAFKISEKTNPNWFATSIEFVDGAGELGYVEIAQAHSTNFVKMQNTWGAVWVANISPSFHAPFSFRLTSPTHKAITAYNVVPHQFVPGKTYYSNVNFW
ncbi:Barwin-like endoglucanase [Artemisia annua]|uniref:Barwin-like endoglucanase n=1 Tax=Artemisia annua TaxID=35608 RepID=A0A2U1NNJ6_ARTAN|nr:Barwin-like endoglucanase [Artemisia annua]